MSSKTTVYDVCRCYVEDESYALTETQLTQINGWLRSRSWKQLSKCIKLLGTNTICPSEYRVLAQVQAFFKKNASLDLCPVVVREAALHTFTGGERRNRITNKRLDHYLSTHPGRLGLDLQCQIARAQAFIAECLGPFSVFLEELPSRIRLTSGATSTRARKDSQPYKKVGMKPVATRGAEPYLKALYAFYGYPAPRVRVSSTNRVEFVPKNCFTERTIACEPEGNIPLQLAFDDYVKSRLKRYGINLSDQSVNQELARLGSIEREGVSPYATVDIENASGTLSFNTVAALIPYEWFKYLTDIRSPHYRIDNNGRGKYAMFSSMGNGATFALETLVFASFCAAVSPGDRWSVYGDDIIVPPRDYQKLVKLLKFFGFKVNTDKSYASGPFRESCGADWFNGELVTPFYIRKWKARGAILAHNINGLVSVSKPEGRVWELCRELCSSGKTPFVPYTLDTLQGVHITPQAAYKQKLTRPDNPSSGQPNFQGRYYRAYQAKGAKGHGVYDSRTLFLWHLDKYRQKKSVPSERSWVPALAQKYVRRWVRWHPPAAGVPTTVYLWSAYLGLD